MKKVGIRFKRTGKLSFYITDEDNIKVSDNVVADNYISSNTKTIKLNELTNGSQALLIGSVRSGDYSSVSSKTSAIGISNA